MTDQRCLKAKQAAKYLGVSAWKLRNLTQNGKLKYIPGDTATAPWLWDIRELDRYVEESQMSFSQY